MSFRACDACESRSQQLCEGCLHNRALIDKLTHMLVKHELLYREFIMMKVAEDSPIRSPEVTSE
jgi:hypothetical protein